MQTPPARIGMLPGSGSQKIDVLRTVPAYGDRGGHVGEDLATPVGRGVWGVSVKGLRANVDADEVHGFGDEAGFGMGAKAAPEANGNRL